ncbi:MAG: aminopeptidase N [Hyphomicrobiaceae bacterium]
MKIDSPKPIYLKNYTPAPYQIDTVDLDISLEPTNTTVRSKLRMRPNPSAGVGRSKAAQPLVLDGENLELLQIRLSGKRLEPADYVVSSHTLTIKKPPSRPFTLEITTTCDPEANTALSGLYRSRGIYCTQCEAEGFRRITYFLDRPDVLAVYTTRIEADRNEASALLSNGNLLENGTVFGTRRHYTVWHDPHPKPSYLFALVGGNLKSIASTFKTMSGRKVDLRIYVEPGKESRCAWAMDALKRSMKWDEKRFGREYDLDVFNIVAVSDFNMGAMENKGLNIFNDKLILASPETATDANYEAIESVIAHEYFHNWTGNRITCRDWFQLCLKEGLTVFRDQEFSADERSRAVQRIADVRTLKSHQFPEDSGPLAHPVRPAKYIEINNFYTATVYEKGAELCRMIQTILGVDGFRDGMDLYFERHDGEAATIEQFLTCFEDATGEDLSQFARWYEQAGTPELVADFDYDPEKQTASLSLNQIIPPTAGQISKKPHHIPVHVGLLASDGTDMPLTLQNGEDVTDGILHLTRREQTFRFTGVTERPVLSLLREFSAPVNIDLEQSDRDLEFLMAHDSDLFNRCQAAQTFATRNILEMVDGIRQGKRTQRGTAFSKALAQSILDEDLEPAYHALFLSVPSEGDLARQIGANVDPDAIHIARNRLRRLVGRNLHDELMQLYRRHKTTGSYKPDAESVGHRSLRNAALSLLAADRTDETISRVIRHYKSATNMTDQIAALAILSNHDSTDRDRAFASFYRRWKNDHLVVDMWFSLQAISSDTSTVDRVAELKDHDLFSLTNPNKVRALIGAFAMNNPVQFHRKDGRGYELVADTVIELDDINPQIASRLMSAFRTWKTLEKGRQRMASRELKRISRKKNLSPDVFEIVSRTIE